jgi:xanthine dehydrogenase YagS FAD-binding subunit
MNEDTIQSAALCLGGVAHKPWRVAAAERALAGSPATPESIRKAADLALAGAKGYEDNTFKIEMAKQAVVRAFTLAARGSFAGLEDSSSAGAQA